MGQVDVQEALTAIEQANLFLIPLDNRREWFRYHRLFRDLLRHRLKQEILVDELHTLHRQSAIWFGKHRLIDEAVHHFLAATEPEMARTLVENHALSAIKAGYVHIAHTWINMLPDAFIRASLRLCLDRAWYYVVMEQHQQLASLLATIHRELSRHTLPNRAELEQELSALQNLLSAYQAAYDRADNQTAFAFGQQALAQLQEDEHFARSWVYLLLISVAVNLGQMDQAVEYAQTAYELCQTTGNRTGSLWAVGLLARAHILRAERPAIERTYQRAFVYARDQGWEYLPYMGTIYQDYG